MADGVTLIPDISQNTGISSGYAGLSQGAGISGNTPSSGTGNHILTEAGAFLNTESASQLITET